MQHCVSTDDLPPATRFEGWADFVLQNLGIASMPPEDGRASFAGRLTIRPDGPLMLMEFAANRHKVARTGHEIGRRPWQSYWIYREASAGAWFRHGGREFHSRRGDLIVADADVEFASRPAQDYRHQAVLMPKRLLDPHLPRPGRPLPGRPLLVRPLLVRPLLVRLSGQTGTQALAASYLTAMIEHWDALDDDMVGASDTLARLIGLACGAAAEAQPEAVQRGRLAEAKRHVAQHLADPELSAGSVAAALGISVRALHLLFEPSGTSFARHVQRQRLEACRAALLADPVRPVLDVAFAWGFNTMSSFYRAFNAAFGQTPGDLRAAASGGPIN